MDRVMELTVSDVARLAGITVRTLHHYDEIGLLRPRRRSEAGYRLYDETDLARLQQVLFYRELGFGLDEIRGVMRDPGFDRLAALRIQRKELAARARRLERMIAAVDAAIDTEETGIMLSKEEMFEVFGDFDPTEYQDEVKERWGDTDAYRESVRRVARYGKEDWLEIKAEGDRVNAALVEAMAAGRAPTDPEVLALAEQHRMQIDRWFYPCPHEMHATLGEMYVADPRFTETYDELAEGLARFVRDAIVANAQSHTTP